MTVLMLLLFVYSASAEKHSVSLHSMLSIGNPNIPESITTSSLDEVTMFYYERNMETAKPLQEWVKELIKQDQLYWGNEEKRIIIYYEISKIFREPSPETEGIRVMQEIEGCEWDDETDKGVGFYKVARNGEDFLSLNVETKTWIAFHPDAEIIKQDLNNIKEFTELLNQLTSGCFHWLKTHSNTLKRFLHRKDLPSVSLLQKTPSSPVTCHATGFYPDRAVMFWRRDGEEVDEGVEHGELLPNPDGTFQMSLHLNISSVSAEDWSRYDCVFQLSGVQSDIVTKLDPTRIRSNHKGPENLPELSERLKPDPETRSTNPS